MSKIKLIKPKVEEILRSRPDSRDNDMIIAVQIWEQEMAEKVFVPSYTFFKNMLIHKGVTSYESITRCRRKIQQHNPELRGLMVKARAAEEENVKQEIRTFSNE